MAGRPRKPISASTRKISKKEKLDRAIQEEKLKIDRDNLTAPDWLNDDAAEEFMRVVDEARKIDILDNLDLAILAVYANAYSQYIRTVSGIAAGGLITSDGDKEVANPLVAIQEKYVKQIMLCSSKLGLSTTDRLKLVMPVTDAPQKNKFLSFVG